MMEPTPMGPTTAAVIEDTGGKLIQLYEDARQETTSSRLETGGV